MTSIIAFFKPQITYLNYSYRALNACDLRQLHIKKEKSGKESACSAGDFGHDRAHAFKAII